MPNSNLPQTTPQFTTAEYSTGANGSCVACHQPITGRYYNVNQKVACENCVQQLRHKFPIDSHAVFMRALLFGGVAAVIGMTLYATFTIVTGIYLGYVALAVGWLVAKGIMLGSKGVGGRRYQVAAVILTYAAVSMAFVPIVISEQSKSAVSFSLSAMQWLLTGLASPFLELRDPFHGVIGLIILFVGIRIAWRMTAGLQGLDIQGPYEGSRAASI